ncbi:MAG: RNA polymerase sporulation sigma factor SigK [Firmicutes bacterium HGW-Firmicutes-12]|jgi:RNA polymerase sporulation-specific sigma factor|nr:MAG: RNA polymerase sporulation sigma factor SigK [Firmicutes bacterium HGW-Firmicutes-12]
MGLASLAITVATIVQSLLLLVYYLNNNAFPQPLSDRQESYYLKLVKKGDMEARNTLIEHNLRLVAHISKKFDGVSNDKDDIISIGTIGLIKAINTFDMDKGTKLATYAARCIENEILMHLRATKKNKGEVSLYDPIGIDKEGNEISLIDVLGTEPDVVLDIVQNNIEFQQLLEKIKYLGKREKKVVELRFGLINGIRKTQREIAKMLGISRSYVSRIEKRALEKLIKELK